MTLFWKKVVWRRPLSSQTRPKKIQATLAVRAVSLWVEKNPIPPANRYVVLAVGRLCPVVPQDNIVVSNIKNVVNIYVFVGSVASYEYHVNRLAFQTG